MTKVDVATRCRLMGFIAGAISGAVVGTLLFPLVGTVIAVAGVGWVASATGDRCARRAARPGENVRLLG